MLNSKGFDRWAEDYDDDVDASDEANSYPFAGYNKVLDYIYQIILHTPSATVLDLGFGTGILTTRLYESGCKIYGQDFSSKMIDLAARKMPKAHLYQEDLTQGLVQPLQDQRYDYIVASYALHHLTDEQKKDLLTSLLDQLKENGQILIGDIAFESQTALEACKKKAGRSWDNDEIYFVMDEWKTYFPSLSFTKLSSCAGVIQIGTSPTDL